jgi:putative tryptophan/tyrosine transport system substrate-binding protein
VQAESGSCVSGAEQRYAADGFGRGRYRAFGGSIDEQSEIRLRGAHNGHIAHRNSTVTRWEDAGRPPSGAVALVTCPLVADAQRADKMPRIGWLGFGSSRQGTDYFNAFRQGLREHGWLEGQNIVIVSRLADGRAERFPGLAAELVDLGVDVIVTSSGEPAIRAAKGATATIPIVMAISADPVETGLVTSLARPGGNVTGLSILAPQVAGKRLELLREAIPRASHVAVLWNAGYPGKAVEFAETERAARVLGVRLLSVAVREANDFPGVFSAIARASPDGLITLSDPLTSSKAKLIADFAARSRLPMMSEVSTFVTAGGLMTYGPSTVDMVRRAAVYVDKILKGAKPADLPVEQPTKFDLVINLKTARALGLTIPPSLQLRADRTID